MTAKVNLSKSKTEKTIRREFGGLPVVDAKESLRLLPSAADVKAAIRKDPTKCVFARACRRMFGSTRVVFWKTTAYVDLTGTDGVRRVERFLVHKKTRELIERFDRGEPVKVGVPFLLSAPNPAQRLDVKKERLRAYVATPNGKATWARTRALQKVGTATKAVAAATTAEQEAKKKLAAATDPKARAAVKKDVDRVSSKRASAVENLAASRKALAVAEKTASERMIKPRASHRKTPQRAFDLAAVRSGAGHHLRLVAAAA